LLLPNRTTKRMTKKLIHRKRAGKRPRYQIGSGSSAVMTRHVRGPMMANNRFNRGLSYEVKCVDVVTTVAQFLAPAGAPVAQLLNGIAGGAGSYQRVGRKVAMQSLYINGYISDHAVGSSNVSEALRILVVYDSQANGATPVWANVVLSSPATTSTGTSLVFDGFNVAQRDRYKILMDKRIHMPAVTATTGLIAGAPFGSTNFDSGNTAVGCTIISEFRKLRGAEIQFQTDNAAIGDIATGSIVMFCVGSTGGQWDLNYTARIRYTDA